MQPLGIHWHPQLMLSHALTPRIVPAVLLAAVTVVKDMDEFETSPPL